MSGHWVTEAAKQTRELFKRIYGTTSQDFLTPAHLMHMLDQIDAGKMSDTKANRWLGWVQAGAYYLGGGGVLLNDLKRINQAASEAFPTVERAPLTAAQAAELRTLHEEHVRLAGNHCYAMADISSRLGEVDAAAHESKQAGKKFDEALNKLVQP